MSKTLEEIQSEIATTAAAINNPTVRTVDLGTTSDHTGQFRTKEERDAREVAIALEKLSKASGVPVERLLAGMDIAAGGDGSSATPLPEGTKTFYCQIPNCGIIIQTGVGSTERVEFKGDTLHTTDPAVIAFLSAIVDKPGSTIYSRSNRQISQEQQMMQADVQAMAQSHHAKMVAAGEKT